MTLPKKMFDNILMEIDPTIAAVSVMQILLVSIVLVLIGRFGRGLQRTARVRSSSHGRQRLPQGLQVDAVVVGMVASQQRAVARTRRARPTCWWWARAMAACRRRWSWRARASTSTVLERGDFGVGA